MSYSNEIEQVAKKYAKRLLTRMESSGTISPEIRKLVLDEINAMAREFAAKQGERHNGIRQNDRE
jgi:hypothetical protein